MSVDITDPTFLAGYLSGLLEGIERGRRQADDEAAALHHRAFTIVQAAAKESTHDELEARRRTYRQAAEPEPWPEWAPIPRGGRSPGFYGPGVRCRGQGLPRHRYDADGTYVTTGWPIEVVLTPAEQAAQSGMSS